MLPLLFVIVTNGEAECDEEEVEEGEKERGSDGKGGKDEQGSKDDEGGTVVGEIFGETSESERQLCARSKAPA